MAPDGYSLATIQEYVGHELGISDWLTIDQDRINAFAECTGDQQWIHVDVERTRRESPFGSTIAHGYLILALLPQFLDAIGLVPAGLAHQSPVRGCTADLPGLAAEPLRVRRRCRSLVHRCQSRAVRGRAAD
jgi:MaoC like domain